MRSSDAGTSRRRPEAGGRWQCVASFLAHAGVEAGTYVRVREPACVRALGEEDLAEEASARRVVQAFRAGGRYADRGVGERVAADERVGCAALAELAQDRVCSDLFHQT